MRNIFLFILIFLLFGGYAISQNELIKVSTRDTIIGEKLLNKQHLNTKKYSFPCPIFWFSIDSAHNKIILQLRYLRNNKKTYKNKGFFTAYNLVDDKILWCFKTRKFNLSDKEGVILSREDQLIYRINPDNGLKIWGSQNYINFVDTANNICLGYSFGGQFRNLKGINLNNGRELWSRKFDNYSGWNDVFKMNDSVVMIIASGMHSVNLKTGKGWDYSAETTASDYSGMIAANAVGLALGVLTGSYMVTTDHTVITDIVSNVVSDSTGFYFASKDNLAHIAFNGKVIWEFSFPKKLTSKSTIFLKDSILYYINNGYAYIGNRQVNFRNFFLAAFNANNGKKIFLSVDPNDNSMVNDFLSNNDTVLLAFDNKLAKYSLNNGTPIEKVKFDVKDNGSLRIFINDKAFFRNTDSTFSCLIKDDPSKIYVYSSKGKLLIFNTKLELLKSLDENQLYYSYLKYRDYTFLSKDNNTYIIDSNNNAIAKIKASYNSFLLNNKFYCISDNCIFETDLSDILH